jgi:glycosyltransferase involved in cell wall biosynthesis
MSLASLSQPKTHTRSRTALPVVCHVVHSLNVGGAELLATRMATRLSDRYQPVFACLDQEGRLTATLQDAGIAWRSLGRRGGLDWRCSRQLAAWLRQEQVALVHAHQFTPFLYTLLSGLLGRRPPVLFTEHGRFFPDSSSWKRRCLSHALLKRSDRIVAVGKAVQQALLDIERLPASQTRVIYNGIASYEPSPRPQNLRQLYHASESTTVMVLVARFDPIKNHALAVEAVHKLAASQLDVQLWLVGDGPQRAATEQLVDQYQLPNHVRFLGERRDVGDILRQADIALLTSHSEGIPLVLIEAMAAGLPVVATAVGGVPELIEHEVQGLLCPAGDLERLAAQLTQLSASPEQRTRMGHAGRARSEEFTEERMLAQYAALYDEMLAR